MSTTSADRLQAALVELAPAQALAAQALTAVVDEALAETGRTLDDLTVSAAIELADGLRAFVAALPALTTHDKRLAADIDAAADLIERHAGTG